MPRVQVLRAEICTTRFRLSSSTRDYQIRNGLFRTVSNHAAEEHYRERQQLVAPLAAAAALTSLLAGGTLVSKREDKAWWSAFGQSMVACAQLSTPGQASRDLTKQTFMITLKFDQDSSVQMTEVSEVFRRGQWDVRDAKITKHEANQVTHTYVLQDQAEASSTCRLTDIRNAFAKLGNMECKVALWPVYTRAQVAEHKTSEGGIWVSYKDGVYDITDFISNHPGGKDKIMLAAGKSIDPFWRIYQQHEGRGTALTTLASMRIGDLADAETAIVGADPYDCDPERHPGLIFHNNKPCNAELPKSLMLDSWLTPNEVWFIRHHHPVPVIDPEKYRLVVDGNNGRTVTLTLEDLKTRFLKREVIATLQCGGNRRSDLDKVEKTSGIPWGVGAISTAKFGGVYLREVLLHCVGLTLDAVESVCGPRHLIAHGMDDMQASIPIEKALSPYCDVLLAYEMNGETLPAEHGFPIRLIAPGVVGVRNVKWVGKINVSNVEAEGPWQRGIAYKGFSPSIKAIDNSMNVEDVMSMQEMPVQSSIVFPSEGEVITLDDVEVRGFAWSGGGRGIVRVDVSVDGGSTWHTAELTDGCGQRPSRAWAWTFWEATVPVPEEFKGKKITLICKATDSSYNVQPERPEPIWNLRGLNCNCWHRVTVQHDDSD